MTNEDTSAKVEEVRGRWAPFPRPLAKEAGTSPHTACVRHLGNGAEIIAQTWCSGERHDAQSSADAIAHAPEDIAFLLGEVSRLEEERAIFLGDEPCPECIRRDLRLHDISQALEGYGATDRSPLAVKVAHLVNENGTIRAEYRALVGDLEVLQAERDALRVEAGRLRCERDGEVWLWAGDGTDDVESLACPVLMSAEQVRTLVGQTSEVEAERDALRSDLEIQTERTEAGRERIAERLALAPDVERGWSSLLLEVSKVMDERDSLRAEVEQLKSDDRHEVARRRAEERARAVEAKLDEALHDAAMWKAEAERLSLTLTGGAGD